MTSALQPGKMRNNNPAASSLPTLLCHTNCSSPNQLPQLSTSRMPIHLDHHQQNNSSGKRGGSSILEMYTKNLKVGGVVDQQIARDGSEIKKPSRNYLEKEKETIVNSDRLRLLLFNHKSRNSMNNNSLNKEQVTLKNLFQVGIEKQPTKKYNHNQLSDNCFDKTNRERINTPDEMNIIKPKWLKSIVENQCDLGFVKENGNFTKTNNMQKIQENNITETKSITKVSKETNDLKKKINTNRKMEKTEKTFNSIMLDLFKERSTEIQPSPPPEIQNNDSIYTRLSKSWNRFLFWWMKWKKDFTSNTIHQFLNSYDPVMRTFECIFLFFETFRIPYPIRYAVHQIRHFLYLIFQFVWTSTFLFEENSEFERELLSHNNNRRNDSQIYNTDPRYYYDDVNYYSQY